MKVLNLCLLAAVTALSNACTLTNFDRSPASGYTDYYESPHRDVSTRSWDNSVDFSSKSLSERESKDFQSQSQRKNLEQSLNTTEEKRQYVRYRPYLSEAERIEFLQLSDVDARERWIQNRGYGFTAERHTRNIASLIEQNDIALGMAKEAVRDSWGDPDYVEVSGNPRFENERWRFSVPIQTPEGYHIEERLVYFESGRVVGWQSR